MTVSAFRITSSYTPKNGDYLVLPYADAQTPCFGANALPTPVAEQAKAHPDAGQRMTVFSGACDKTQLMAVTQRLDGKHLSLGIQGAKLVSTALSDAKSEKAERVVILADSKQDKLVRALQEGALLGGYAFDKYIDAKASKKAKPLPVLLVTNRQPSKKLKKALKADKAILECVNFARDVLNEPPSVIRPPKLASEFKAMGKASGLKVSVWDDKKLTREGCGGILGVGRGSSAKPRLVIGEYKPKGAKKHLCLVGKGVTFDTGGYCLKPGTGQVGMKYDMGGAAMMFAAACAIARTKLPIRVTVFTPLAENAIDGDAYLTTSILTMRNGKTVEVHNTDAEGRLILADALCLAAEKKPDVIVDSATLTGACVVALGDDIAGAYGSDPETTQAFLRAGAHTGERFWELPLHKPYMQQLKTTIADCKNIGNKYGGSITAALFLSKFVPDDMKWIHLDIAGPGIKEEPLDHLGKGAKGFGVKAAVRFAEQLGG